MPKDTVQVYLEIGQTRTFAVALDWPGWCRSGRDEAAALQSLYESGPRYASIIQATQLNFHAPSALSELTIVERVNGNKTTDFGAPDVTLSSDSEPVSPQELQRWRDILNACWQAFDLATQSATGKELRKGPRGGGRDLSKIVQHVREVEAAYVSSLGGKVKISGDDKQALAQVREAILSTLTAAANGEIPAHGPRGGARWLPRYFVRRLAWHELDHVWEIEDRVTG